MVLPTDRSTSNTVGEHITDHNELHTRHNDLLGHETDTTSVHGITDTSLLITGITVQDENGALASDVTQLDFQGAGVTATVGAGEVIVTIPGGGAGLTVQDENGNVSTAVSQIDFQGAGVTAALGSSEVIVTIPGGGSGAANSADQVRFVSSVGNDSTGDGLSWSAAYATIQKAISSLTAGGVVFVGAGTYTTPFGIDRDNVRICGVAWGGGTIVERQTDRTMVNIRRLPDTSAALHRRYWSIENIQFKDNGVGNNPANPFFKMHFASNGQIKDCRFAQIKGVMFSFVETYDCAFRHLYGVDVGGSDGTKPAIYCRNALDTTTAGLGTVSSSGATVTGTGTYFESWVQVGDTITAAGQTKTVATVDSDTSLTTTTNFSPVLSGATWTVRHNDTAGDNSNNLDFVQLHLESFQDGAIWMVGTNSSSGAMNKCKFTQLKLENRKVQNGTPAIKLHYANQIHFDDVQITYGAFNTTGTTAVADMILLSNSDGIYFGDAYLEANGSDDCTNTMVHLAGGAKRVSFNALRWVTANSNLPAWIFKFDTSVGSGTNTLHPGLMEQVSGGAGYAPGGATFASGLPDSDLTRYFQDRVQTVTYAASVTPEPYSGEDIKITLTGNISMVKPTKGRTSDRMVIIFTQDATGGRTVTWGAGYSATSGWSVNATANAVSSIQFLYDGTNWIRFPT